MKTVNHINILCNGTRIQNMRFRCTCGHSWVEAIPLELLQSDLVSAFECSACKRQHLMYHKKFKIMTTEELERAREFPFRGQAVDDAIKDFVIPNDPIKYDA